MTLQNNISKSIYAIIAIVAMFPFVSPAIALAGGMILSFSGVRLPSVEKYTSKVLQASIVLMGFGMSLTQVMTYSKSGFSITAISVLFVMLTGLLLGKVLKIEKNITILISAGTAICGGSAIAAISSVLGSKNYQNSFALAVVFVLNAVALFLFPWIGHKLNLSQEVFGHWAAIAIHDTSSVVGAAAIYGDEALEIATTVKLIRALWIIPLSLVIALFQKGNNKGKIKIPWFILIFVLSIVLAHLLPQFDKVFHVFSIVGKRGMVLALILIGASISIEEVKKSGTKSFILGVGLWAFIAIGSLLMLLI